MFHEDKGRASIEKYQLGLFKPERTHTKRGKGKKLKGLAYYGGKSPERGLCKWIGSIIGLDPSTVYIEPFAGMLGVLLSRPKAKIEIVNDVNGNLVNWWVCVRDHPDELARMVRFTPWSRRLFAESCIALKKGRFENDLQRALAFHVVLEQSITKTVISTPGQWSIKYNFKASQNKRWSGDLFTALAERLKDVKIENRQAAIILKRTRELSKGVIYCDPPYRTAGTSPYGRIKTDWNEVSQLLDEQKCRVAVSGYGEEWDHLGWARSEYETKHLQIGASAVGGKSTKRVEVLWTNFKPSISRSE